MVHLWEFLCQCQDDQEVTQQIHLWELGYSNCGQQQRSHCAKVEGYLWNSFGKLQKLPFHKTPLQKVSLSLRWLRCGSETMSIVRRLSTMSSCPGGEGKWQRTCSGCHIVCSGSLCSRVCSSPGQGRGLSSSMITGTWFSMSLTVLSFDSYVNLIRQVYELGAHVVLCSRCGLAFLLRWIPFLLRWIPLWTFAVFLERVLPIWLQVPLRTLTASGSIPLWQEACGFIAFHQEAQISGFSHLQAVWRCHCGIYILL